MTLLFTYPCSCCSQFRCGTFVLSFDSAIIFSRCCSLLCFVVWTFGMQYHRSPELASTSSFCSNMGKILVAVTIALCAFAWRMYESMDLSKKVYNHRPGICRQVHGPSKQLEWLHHISPAKLMKSVLHHDKQRLLPVKGSEDIELIRSEGIAFITSGILYLQPYRGNIVEGIFRCVHFFIRKFPFRKDVPL